MNPFRMRKLNLRNQHQKKFMSSAIYCNENGGCNGHNEGLSIGNEVKPDCQAEADVRATSIEG